MRSLLIVLFSFTLSIPVLAKNYDQRHQPEHTVLYKIVQENLETFLRLVHQEYDRPLPDFVEKEFRDYLKCGILAHGFLRSKCESWLIARSWAI